MKPGKQDNCLRIGGQRRHRLADNCLVRLVQACLADREINLGQGLANRCDLDLRRRRSRRFVHFAGINDRQYGQRQASKYANNYAHRFVIVICRHIHLAEEIDRNPTRDMRAF